VHHPEQENGRKEALADQDRPPVNFSTHAFSMRYLGSRAAQPSFPSIWISHNASTAAMKTMKTR
jgi:hypothetical protein